MNTYAPGSEVVFDFDSSNADGQPTDMSAVVAKTLAPDGTETEYTLGDLTHLGSGSYRLTIIVATPGKWTYKAAATGTLTCATLDQEFYVEASRMP